MGTTVMVPLMVLVTELGYWEAIGFGEDWLQEDESRQPTSPESWGLGRASMRTLSRTKMVGSRRNILNKMEEHKSVWQRDRVSLVRLLSSYGKKTELKD